MEFIVHDKAQERRVSWTGARLLIGRREGVDIQVDEPTMSAVHAEIVPVGEEVRIRDLHSLNGTRLNGRPIAEAALHDGDEVRIGKARITVSRGLDTRPESARAPLYRQSSSALEDQAMISQTVSIDLARLRRSRRDELGEDERIVLLRDLFETLQPLDDGDEVLANVREVLGQAFLHSRVFILRPGEGDDDWYDPEATADTRPPSLTFASEAARSRSAILSTSLPDDQRFAQSESAHLSGIKTAIAAPASCDGRPVAVLYVDRLLLPAFTIRELNLLGIAANHVSAVLENVARIVALRSTNRELRDARQRLAELNRDLEQRVEDRTAEIRRQAEEIGQLAEAKDELLGIAAHDIRGPLTVIQGTSELLRLRLDNAERATLERSLDLIHGTARNLGQLLSELLDARAIETGRVTLSRRLVPIRRLAEEALPVAQLAAEDKGIELALEANGDDQVFADPRRLGQAITNLVLNAVKFSETGTRIILRGRTRSDGSAVLEVEDQGVGIEPEEIERIFGSFEQGAAGRKVGGSGLGLMIARRLVELHGGVLDVSSKVGVGTLFTLSLPAAESHEP